MGMQATDCQPLSLARYRRTRRRPKPHRGACQPVRGREVGARAQGFVGGLKKQNGFVGLSAKRHNVVPGAPSVRTPLEREEEMQYLDS